MTARPRHYRPAIPMRVKGEVLIRQEGRCTACRGKLGAWSDVNFDHDPALALRGWNEYEGDTVPPANDPNYIFAKHKTCHGIKTFGAGATTRGSDIHELHRGRRLARKQAEHEAALRAKQAGAACDAETDIETDAEIDDEPQEKEKPHRRTSRSRLRGPGFKTNRNGPFKAKLGGGVVPRAKR
ncbi:MAG: hypothetical protein ACM31O_03480 [Bacteroidota bacterium]